VDTLSNQANLATNIVAALRAVVGGGAVALHEPYFGGNEWKYLKECLDSTYVSSVGAFVERFEGGLADFTGAGHAIAVVNGTAALQVALQLAGVQQGEEVLVPSLTFVATSNAVAHCGAVPHFIESEQRSFGVDADALGEYLSDITELRHETCFNRLTGRIIRALVPMHVFGHPVELEKLLQVAARFHLVLIEDAAESLGSYYQGRHTGTFGMLGTLSFNGNKTITTGGGGALLTNDAGLARKAKHLTTTAKIPHRWEFAHDELGYNYRLPNLNAALGCAQLEQLPRLLTAKRHLHQAYAAEFAAVQGVRLATEAPGCRSNFWLQALVLDEARAAARDDILSATNDCGLMTRPIWRLNHTLPMYRSNPRMPLAVAESLERRVINIPSSAQLALEAVA
jgi:perosamine synthetase